MSKVLQKTITPKCGLAWATITGEGVENMSGRMQYKIDAILDPQNNPEHKAYIDAADQFWKDNKPEGFKRKAKSMGYSFCDKVLDAEGEPVKNEDDRFVYDPKGKVSMCFKTAIAYPDGSPKVVVTKNAKNQRVELGQLKIGNGSVGYVGGAIDVYTNTNKKGEILDAGVTFYLDEIKIISLEEYSQSAFDGTPEEDGWTGAQPDMFEVNEESEDAETRPRL